MKEDDISDVLASWLWATSRETAADRLPSVGTLMDAANQSPALSEVVTADDEVRKTIFSHSRRGVGKTPANAFRVI